MRWGSPMARKQSDVEDAIAHMSEAHVKCRDWRHKWEDYWAEELPRRQGYVQLLRCERCKTIRRRLIDRNGAMGTCTYRPGEGYYIKGLGRLGAEEHDLLRLAAVRAQAARSKGRRPNEV